MVAESVYWCPNCRAGGWAPTVPCVGCSYLEARVEPIPLAPAFDPTPYTRPLWFVVLLTVLSLGLYIFPYMARMLCFVDAVNGRPVSRKRARLHTLGLFVPFYNLAMWHHLAAKVRQKLGPDDDMLGPNVIVFLVMVTGGMERLLPGWWSVLAFLPLLTVLLTIQAAVNACCERA